jgi:hypothetical protein
MPTGRGQDAKGGVCRVTLGGCPPRVPTDPDVRLRAHPARQSMASLPKVTRLVIRCRCVDTVPRFNALAVFPFNGSMLRRPLPSPGCPWSESPWLSGVGSEEARSVTLTLASVRRSNGACGFPALRFHKGTLQA